MKLIGLAELAELYSVSKNTASTWSRQRDWPAPVTTLKMGPIWDQDAVLAHRPIEDYGQAHKISCAWCGSAEFDHNGYDVSDLLYCGCGKVTIVSLSWNSGSVTIVARKKKEEL